MFALLPANYGPLVIVKGAFVVWAPLIVSYREQFPMTSLRSLQHYQLHRRQGIRFEAHGNLFKS